MYSTLKKNLEYPACSKKYVIARVFCYKYNRSLCHLGAKTLNQLRGKTQNMVQTKYITQ